MKTDVAFFNLSGLGLKKSFFLSVVKVAISEAKELKVEMKISSLSVIFLKKMEIRRLNAKYREKNMATDVLSFDYNLFYNKSGIKKKTKGNVDGEIFLCPKKIKENAKKNRIGFGEEMAFVFSHGLLHLAGLRHGKKMFAIQKKVSEKIKLRFKL